MEPTTTAETATPTEAAAKDSQAVQEPEQQPGEPKTEKTVPLSELISVRKRAKEAETRLAEFEAREAERKRAEMSELDRLKTDFEATQAELQGMKQGQRKQSALDKAVSEIGEGWTVEHALADLRETVRDLAYDEKTIDEKVKRLVEVAKRQKTPEPFAIRGTLPPVQPKIDPSKPLTPYEQAQQIIASRG